MKSDGWFGLRGITVLPYTHGMEQTRSKVTAKYQATIPAPIRDYLKLKQGDTVEFSVVNKQVVLRRSAPLDMDYLRSVEQTLTEWNSTHNEAYDELWNLQRLAFTFPVYGSAATKRRPAVVLSSAKNFNDLTGHSLMAMITASENTPWTLDTEVKDLAKAGLNIPSVIRLKLFTLDHRLVIKRLGKLSVEDVKRLEAHLKRLLTLWTLACSL
jgi:mRNA interferase MazF